MPPSVSNITPKGKVIASAKVAAFLDASLVLVLESADGGGDSHGLGGALTGAVLWCAVGAMPGGSFEVENPGGALGGGALQVEAITTQACNEQLALHLFGPFMDAAVAQPPVARPPCSTAPCSSSSSAPLYHCLTCHSDVA